MFIRLSISIAVLAIGHSLIGMEERCTTLNISESAINQVVLIDELCKALPKTLNIPPPSLLQVSSYDGRGQRILHHLSPYVTLTAGNALDILKGGLYIQHRPTIDFAAQCIVVYPPLINQIIDDLKQKKLPNEQYSIKVIEQIARFYFLFNMEMMPYIDAEYTAFSVKDYLEYKPELLILGKDLGCFDIGNLVLQKLKLNSLQGFSDILGLANIKRLVLSHNKLYKLKKNMLHTMKSLEDLFIDNNELHEIPSDFLMGLNNLKRFNCSCNQLQNFESIVFNSSPNLEEIDLHDNELLELDPRMFQILYKLQKIDFRNNKLSKENKEALKKVTGPFVLH
jgi:hypothetical protein